MPPSFLRSSRLLGLVLLAGCVAAGNAPQGPDFAGVVWVDGAPDLRGKVALVRWWTSG
jgi:hypothetical protein